LPPVLTSWLAATVGGTLSTGGFSKGSHRYGLQIDHVTELVVVTGDGRTVTCGPKQAAWLFDAVLGGWGRFGVILEATLPLIDHPPRLDVVSTRVSDALALRDALEAAAAADATYHVTSYRAADGAWVVVTASASDTGTTTLESYVDPERPSAPLPEQLWLHLFAPSATLPELLTAFTDVLRADDGDKVQVIPVRKMREHRASFVRLPDVPVGSLVHAVLVTREVRQRDRAALDAETRELDALARTLGATSTLAGTLPRDEAEWRAHLGASADDVARTLRVADPDGVLLGDGATTFKQ
jgi:FAD/FMN-containing dehydrogenase